MSCQCKPSDDKPRISLLPPEVVWRMARVMEHGAYKHGEADYANLPGSDEHVNKALRHIFRHLRGRHIDPETGEHHLVHAACDLVIAAFLELRNGRCEMDARRN